MVRHINHKAASLIVVLALIILDIVPVVICRDEATPTTRIPVEPPFPKIFDLVERAVQIVSEYWDEHRGYGSVEEYLDIALGRAAYVIRLGDLQDNILIDAVEDKFYRYKPYSCEVGPQSKLEETALGTWSISFAALSNKTTPEKLNLRLFDAIGYWVFASQNAFTYEHADQLYSEQNNKLKQKMHTWSFNDTERKVRIEMTFRETATNGREQPTFDLSLIRKLTLMGELLRSYNILAVERELDRDAYDMILQVPVGHQCSKDEDESEYERKLREQSNPIFTSHRLYAQKIDLQITATRFSDTGGRVSGRDSDTLYLELAHRLQANGAHFMFRLQDTKTDIKHVIDYDCARYEIDLLSGSCTMSHAFGPEEEDSFELAFANGMHWYVDLSLLIDLFDKRDGYKFVKEVIEQSTKYAFFELSNPDFGRSTRVFKKFKLEDDYYDLDSVTIWFLNDNDTLVDKMIYFSLLDEKSDELWSESTNGYDISEECYLNNDQMKNGRDYAWLEFTYPLDTREINPMVAHSEVVKAELHKKFADFFDLNLHHLIQLPRIELMFEDDDMVVRLLALDSPPPEIMFERIEGKSIENYSLKHKQLSPDLGHCSESCRLGHCSSMTFCRTSFTCYYSRAASPEGSEFTNRAECDTFVRRTPEDRIGLKNIISQARRLDYSPLELPEPSAELLLERKTNSDIYTQVYDEHVNNTMQKIKNERPGLQEMSLVIEIDGLPVVLVPSGFHIESDPWADSVLIDLVADQDRLPAYHRGLSWFRYKPEAFNDNHKSSRHFQSLNYDQCALACTDTRCGSFSYCPSRKECVITANNDTAYAQAFDLIEQDLDCFIMQRDFLSNFDQFPNVLRPSVNYKIKTQVTSPSECALECVSDSGGRCLAFDYCDETTGTDQEVPVGTCYLQSSRHMSNLPARQNDEQPDRDARQTGCTHYSRSYLADFIRIESHKIDPRVTEQLETSKFIGKTVFQCAELCVSELGDCYAFEFCFSDQDDSNIHSCEMIEGKFSTFESESGRKLLNVSEDCHVYYLRNDSIEAQLMHLIEDDETVQDTSRSAQLKADESTGLTFARGLMIYFFTALVSTVAGFGIHYSKNSDYVKRKIERTRILLGV